MSTVELSFFSAVDRPRPARRSMAWSELVAWLRDTPPEAARKADLPLLSGTLFEGRRSAANARTAAVVFAEHDAGSVSIDEAAERARAYGLRCAFYTSPSHRAEAPRWRVVCPLAAPVDCALVPELVGQLNAVLRGALARESWEGARQWYVGRVASAPDYRVVEVQGNSTLDLLAATFGDSLPCQYAPVGAEPRAPSAAEPVTDATLADLRAALGYISADDRATWIAVGQHLHGLGEAGRELWVGWSQRSPAWQDGDIDRWDTFDGSRSDYRAVFTKAAAAGWVNGGPSNVADVSAFEPLPEEEPAHVFTRTRQGRIEATTPNLIAAVRDPERCGYRWRFDEFLGQEAAQRVGSDEWVPLTDAISTWVLDRLEAGRAGFAKLGRAELSHAIHAVATQTRVDSAKEWADGLVWDGVPRIDRFLSTHAGVPDSAYARAVSAYMWTALAGRVMHPGCQADMVPVLVGAQGLRKSTLVAALAPFPTWAGSVDLADRDNDTARALRGRVVLEMDELKGLAGRQAEGIKSFITRKVEEYRPLYREHLVQFPRRCLLVGSSNRRDFLNDDTGNRRWLPIEVGTCDPDRVVRDRSQLWAEAITVWRESGIRWQDAQRLAVKEHAAFELRTPLDERVAEWLDLPVARIDGEDSPGVLNRHRRLKLLDVAREALDMDGARVGGGGDMPRRIGGALRAAGMVEKRFRMGGRQERFWTEAEDHER